MTPEEKNAIKKDIQKNIKDLKERITALEKSSKPVAPDNAIGRLSRMDAIQITAMGEAGLARFRQELHDLEQKLIIIDTPGFGICRFCKGAIGIERLKALPGTDKCITCAEKHSI